MFKIKIRSAESINGNVAPGFAAAWKTLEAALDEIFKGNVNNLSFERLYHTVYVIVLRKQGTELYDSLRDSVSVRLRNSKETIINSDRTSLLNDFLCLWEKQCQSLRLISDVTMYLDRVYCKENRKSFVFDMGLQLFRDNIMMELKDDIHSLMIQQINSARLGQKDSNLAQLKEVVGLMEMLSSSEETYFQHNFEPFLLEETQAFYKDFMKSKRGIADAYIRNVKSQLELESELCNNFLNSDTCLKVTKLVEGILISENITFLAGEVLSELLREGDYATLKLLFQLCHEPKDKSHLLKQVSSHFVKEGMGIEEDRTIKKKGQVAFKWISDVLQLKKKYEDMISLVGEEDTTKQSVIGQSLATFLNQNGRKTAEYLAIYMDTLLRLPASAENISKESLEECTAIFKALREKDIFERVYKQQLSKRLLQQRSSLKVEKQVISKMKEEVGSTFTSKLEGMFRDMMISQSYNAKFQQSYGAPFPYEANVLTSTCWPFQGMNADEEEVVLPTDLERLKLDFENFYIKNHSGRSLRWAYHLGSMEIGFQFARSYHEISMPVYAGVIFMLFENHEELTMQEISNLTRMPEHELVRHLLTLSVAPKTRLLKKRPLTKTILPTDRFNINQSFQAPTTKVKVLAVLPKADSGFPGLTSLDDSFQSVIKDRKGSVEAAIVRSLKSLKSSDYDSLFENVQSCLSDKFSVSKAIFKESLERMCEREYVQHDPDDASFYHYLP